MFDITSIFAYMRNMYTTLLETNVLILGYYLQLNLCTYEVLILIARKSRLTQVNSQSTIQDPYGYRADYTQIVKKNEYR